jgi:rubrerythrin
MSKQNLDLVDAIQIALEAEKKSVAAYSDAAEKAPHGVLQRLFNDLAEFEQLHYDKVAELAESLRKKGKYIVYEASTISIPAQSEVQFSTAEADALTAKKTSLMDVLTMAQNIEKNANKRYAALAEQTDDPDGKAMFQRLSKEEKGHLQLLTEVYWNLNDLGVLAWSEL